MQARRDAATNRLMAPAMSGDLQALNQLMSVNPEAGMQVQNVMANRQQQQLQQEQARRQQEQQAYTQQQDALNLQLQAMKAGAQYDPATQTLTPAAADGFKFQGGLTADLLNLISEAESNPAIKQTPQYKLAVAQLSKPQYIQTEQGMMQIPGIDISAALGGRPAAAPAAPGGAVPGTEKTSPLQKEYTDKWQARERINNAVNSYKDVLAELGPQMSIGPLNAKDEARLASAYTKLQLESKTAAELGALSGPDLGLIENWLPNPTSLKGASKGKDALLGALDQYMSALEDDQRGFESSYADLNVKQKPLTKLKRQPKKAATLTKNQRGWVLHTDANGNKAYVGPNGEIEEVK